MCWNIQEVSDRKYRLSISSLCRSLPVVQPMSVHLSCCRCLRLSTLLPVYLKISNSTVRLFVCLLIFKCLFVFLFVWTSICLTIVTMIAMQPFIHHSQLSLPFFIILSFYILFFTFLQLCSPPFSIFLQCSYRFFTFLRLSSSFFVFFAFLRFSSPFFAFLRLSSPFFAFLRLSLPFFLLSLSSPFVFPRPT